jgi:hypothetical protein
VGLLRIRSLLLLLRRRRRGAALAAVALVAAAIAVHHLAPALAAGTGGHHDGHGDAVAELCLGVLTAVGAAIAVGGALLHAAGRRLGRWRDRLLPLAGIDRAAPPPRTARARAGPFFLCVMRC